MVVKIKKHGAVVRGQFRERNEHYFEAAIEINPLHPDVAFELGRRSAGLHTSSWARTLVVGIENQVVDTSEV